MVNDVLGKLVADKYRIESLVREGESGDLYTARHEILDKRVTLRILPPAMAIDARWVKRFVDEARTASAVSHPNILNLTDFGTDAKEVSYAVFDPADGKTLREILTSEPAFDEKRSLGIAKQIAAAVSVAHGKRVLHGSLSPNNIFITSDEADDAVKVYGFGADPMKVARDAEPQYLSPEQCTAFPAAGERSDIYSLGIILYEMLSGVVPFDGATAADVMAKQNSEPPPPLSAFRRDLHGEIEPIVLTAIAADPEKRYQTMAAFAEDLEIVSGRIGVPAKAAAAAGDAPKRNIWQTAFIALAGISLLAVALIYAASVRGTDPTIQMQADAGSLPVQPIGPATGALEDDLAKRAPMTDAEAEMMANSNMALTMELPGGDGYNPWATGSAPPPGAPLPGSLPPGGQVYTVDPNSPSQFMQSDPNCIQQPSGILLCYGQVPANTAGPVLKPVASPTPKTPKTPPGNTTAQPTPESTPKPLATPPPKPDKPAANAPAKGKSKTDPKAANSGKPKVSE